MDGVVDLAESRKARHEKNENVREASQELLALLDHHRGNLPESFMAFLLAMAVSDQAIQYTDAANDRQAGEAFMEEVSNAARQLFEAYYPAQGRPIPLRLRSDRPSSRVIPLLGDVEPTSLE